MKDKEQEESVPSYVHMNNPAEGYSDGKGEELKASEKN